MTAMVPPPLQGSAVRRGIDTQSQPADNDQAGASQGFGKSFGIGFALATGIATADHRQRRPVEQLDVTLDIKKCRRIGAVEQGLRVIGIAEGNNPVTGFSRPGQGRFDCRGNVILLESFGQRRADHGAQGSSADGEHRFCGAECLQ